MNTRKQDRNKTNRINKTRKNKNKNITFMPDIKVFLQGNYIYGAKNRSIGPKILDYTRSNEKKKKTHCVYENISWFASLEQAKHYKGKDDNIFRWIIKKKLNLVKITEKNQIFFRNLFLHSRKHIEPKIKINAEVASKINYEHPFLRMNDKEKALYEFNFLFGYIRIKEQFEFLLLLKYLLENKIIEILSRKGISLLPKIKRKIQFYNLYPFGKKDKFNRISVYGLEKHVLVNLCSLIYNKYNIDGLYQPNTNSFWFPDLIVYHMNIEEIVLFSPHTELENNGIIEE
jgi:hypothetical protein